MRTDKNERVHFNMGMLAMDDKNIEEAENWFRRAVHLKHDFRSALFNLALLLADDQRPLEAASFLNQLVKYHPDHTKGLILLGDIYINHVKDLDAAENVITKQFFNICFFVFPFLTKKSLCVTLTRRKFAKSEKGKKTEVGKSKSYYTSYVKFTGLFCLF